MAGPVLLERLAAERRAKLPVVQMRPMTPQTLERVELRAARGLLAAQCGRDTLRVKKGRKHPRQDGAQLVTHAHQRPAGRGAKASSTLPGSPEVVVYPEPISTMPSATTAPGEEMEPPFARTWLTVSKV